MGINNIFKKNAFSLIALVITVTCIIILLSTVVFVGKNMIDDAKLQDFAKELYSVKLVADEYEFKNNKLPVEDTDYTLSNNDIDFESLSLFEDEPRDANSIMHFKKIDLSLLNIVNISRGNGSLGEDDIYLISETTKKVYYKKGEKISGKVYYTLTDELYKKIGMSF